MMPRRAAPARIVFCLLLCALASQVARAQQRVLIEPLITLHAVNNSITGPHVNSFARAILYYISNGQRAYNTQVILGHRVWDLDAGFREMYNAQIVSEIGYANSAANFLPAVWNHCHGAGMVAHVNSDNLHENLPSGIECVSPPEPRPEPDPPDENCPVILDLRLDGFHLSGPNPAVLFDIDADGVRDPIAWTRANDDDAFLCLDRNGNGLIDDGTELFGYATPLRNGQPARVGYRALAELDSQEAGGNLDGVVDASDAGFASLCVWVDRNRDGVSQPQEMSGLDPAGVAALEYRYRVTQLRDSYGNLFRYVSTVKMRTPSGALRSWPSFDVIFTEP